MSNPVSREFLKEVEEYATNRCMEIAIEMADRMVQDGLAYGDIPFDNDADFAAFYIDLQDRGVLRFLPVVSPKLARELDSRFARAQAKFSEEASAPRSRRPRQAA